MRQQPFEWVTQDAESDDGMVIKDRLMFHYFNPRGLYHEYKAQCDKITEMVNAGIVKSGWHLAYGTLADNGKQLSRLAMRKRVNGRTARVCLEMLKWHIDTANKRIAEVMLVHEIKMWAEEHYETSYGASCIIETMEDKEILEDFKSLDDAKQYAAIKDEQYAGAQQ